VIEACDYANMMRPYSNGANLGGNMRKFQSGNCTVIYWPGNPQMPQEGHAPLAMPVQPNLAGSHAVVGPGAANQPAKHRRIPIGVQDGPAGCSSHSTGLRSPFDTVATTTAPLVTDDRLREAYLALVRAMVGVMPVTGLGGGGADKSD